MLRLHAPVFSRKHFDGADDIVYQSAGHKLSLYFCCLYILFNPALLAMIAISFAVVVFITRLVIKKKISSISFDDSS
jgi:hypothetical protein